MNSENVFIAHPSSTEQLNALKAFLKALKIRFEVKKLEETYDPDFVEKINKGRQDFKEGKGKSVTIEELNDLWK